MQISVVIAAVLTAAFLHALWNAAVKGHRDRFSMMLMVAVVQLTIALLIVPFLALPARASWPWLLITAIPHTTYKIALAKAYDAGDMTRIYPIGRGLSVVMVTMMSIFMLREDITLLGFAGIAAIAVGLFFLSVREGINVTGLSRSAVLLCVGVGASVAVYTVLDGVGVRASANIAAFAVWLFILDGLGMVLFALCHRGARAFVDLRATGLSGLFAGCTAFVCYWIVIWALAYAPVASVAVLRETSVLFSLLLGRLHLSETVGYRRWIAASVVFCGIVILRFA
jgi:drug/metabolite transporter (DMT)-like permease